jgi:hypothetical protein
MTLAIGFYKAPAWRGASLNTGTTLPILHMFLMELISDITGESLG